MAFQTENFGVGTVRFTVSEVTGALGDSVTVLPLVVALGALTPASLPHVLLWFGVFQVVWGLVYGLPLSVEPMKALAGLAIAGVIGYGELLAAGLAAGVVLLVTGRFGLLSRVEHLVGEPVVRGVQLAVALLLLQSGLDLGLSNLPLAGAATLLTLGAFLLGYRRASTLVVLGLGALLAVVTTGLPSLSVPTLTLFPTALPHVTWGAAEATGAQLAMTVGNAAVATSLLCSDLFDADVPADDLASSMGVTCLVSVPFGGLPMCHGSGGLAGKYAFGARTGGANLILGGLYVVAAVGAAAVSAFPLAVLGVLLVVVAWQLGRKALSADDRVLTVGVGLVGLVVNVGVAFVLGAAAYLLVQRYRNGSAVAGRP